MSSFYRNVISSILKDNDSPPYRAAAGALQPIIDQSVVLEYIVSGGSGAGLNLYYDLSTMEWQPFMNKYGYESLELIESISGDFIKKFMNVFVGHGPHVNMRDTDHDITLNGIGSRIPASDYWFKVGYMLSDGGLNTSIPTLAMMTKAITRESITYTFSDSIIYYVDDVNTVNIEIPIESKSEFLESEPISPKNVDSNDRIFFVYKDKWVIGEVLGIDLFSEKEITKFSKFFEEFINSNSSHLLKLVKLLLEGVG